jgi:chemotaxis protein histidine kinase CheA
MSWTTISVRREVRERIEAFMREKGFVSPSDAIAFLFEHYDSRTRLEEKVRELEDRLSFVEKYMEDLLFKAPQAQAQAPQAPQQPPAPQPQPQQQPQQPSALPEPKLIPASELPEAKKALEEAEARPKAEPSKAEEAKKEAKVELRNFVIKRNPSNPEAYRKWLESQGRAVTGEVEEVTKKGLVKVVFGTTPEVVERICEKLTELKVPRGAVDDRSERAKLDRMFTEEPFANLGTRAYLLSRACLIYRDRDGVWRRA